MAVIGIDLGGTKFSAALFDSKGTILKRSHELLQGRQGNQVGGLIQKHILELFQQAKACRKFITGIGISVPGITWPNNGTVWAPNIPGWKKYPLRREIEKLVVKGFPIKEARLRPRVIIESDRACYILGEKWQGAARHFESAIYLAVGTGIGAGIMVDGKILRGSSGCAGAAGWMALSLPFQKEYSARGCLETHASGVGITKKANALLRGSTRTEKRVRKGIPELKSAAEIFSACERGELIGTHVIDNAITLWGMAAANLISILNPETIIFGGGVFGPAGKFLPRIRAEARQWAQPIAFKKVKFQLSRLGPNAGLYGAAYLALAPRRVPPCGSNTPTLPVFDTIHACS